ncbi:hypothetical protein TNIN_248831 [Trichonephila inaurata madagascariensis]|uniref:Uncharacterized protein n=1 Tax=Trichonephila inaurata madagascariensis TaxID=2747483 RepID=A0A8X6XV12_9ARAC|nr:hypothetical protein TNIN_248831 [Trichonephila inaurata madagascariensis]
MDERSAFFPRAAHLPEIFTMINYPPYMSLFPDSICSDIVYVDDFVLRHRVPDAEDFLECDNIKKIDWSAFFLDLNPNGYVWYVVYFEEHLIAETTHRR